LMIAILASPSLFTLTDTGRTLTLSGPINILRGFIQEIGSEEFFTVYFGTTPRSLLTIIPSYAMTSLSYLLTSTVISMIFGLALGLWYGTHPRKRGLGVFTALSAIPDFILILLLEMVAVFSYQRFGVRIAYLNYSSTDHMLTIPLFTMVVISMAYVARTTARHTMEITAEDYIQYAKAKGLPRTTIIFRHILTGVLQRFKGDLHKLISIIAGTLFITERMFSIPGLTRLLFAYGFNLEYNAYYGLRDYSVNFRITLTSIVLIGAAVSVLYLTSRILISITLRACTYERFT
ncbi:MAG: ABC transporter permease subunit, partial [Spirochaetia bacterium]|nr:ABC transporter permease subunit [Spirochaetia bacterium]